MYLLVCLTIADIYALRSEQLLVDVTLLLLC